MYPIDWLVNLLSPTQWIVVGIVVTITCMVLFPIVFPTEDADDIGLWITIGMCTPLLFGVVVLVIFNFISFLVWLWIGAP